MLLGRYDQDGHLRHAGRSSPLRPDQALALAALLTPAAGDHPWSGRSFKAAWGAKADLPVTLVAPDLVAEISADVARDQQGRWRHLVRYLRVRAELHPMDVPGFGEPDQPPLEQDCHQQP